MASRMTVVHAIKASERPTFIGERERANLVVQLARFSGIFMSIRAPSVRNAHAHSLRAPLDRFLYKRFTALWIQFLLATSMDSECPTPNVQPTLDDGATPSAEACDQTAATAPSRASESTEARDRKLARDRARRRERQTAEEKERRLSQRRVRD